MTDAETLTPDLAGGLSPRMRGIGTSQIGLVADRGRDDPDVVKLWIGEGDLPTPPFIVEAAHRAMLGGTPATPPRSACRACARR